MCSPHTSMPISHFESGRQGNRSSLKPTQDGRATRNRGAKIMLPRLINVVALFNLMLVASAWAADPPTPSPPRQPRPATPAPGAATPGTAVPPSDASKATPESLEPEPVAEADLAKGYTLGVGDVVRLTVFQQADMNSEMRVSETGTISVPLIGVVHIGGLSARQTEDKIARLLKARGFVKDPQVN